MADLVDRYRAAVKRLSEAETARAVTESRLGAAKEEFARVVSGSGFTSMADLAAAIAEQEAAVAALLSQVEEELG